jgi:hypothetical protein
MSTTLIIFAGVFAATVAVRSLDAAPVRLAVDDEVKVAVGEGSFMSEIDDPVAMACAKNARRAHSAEIPSASDPSQCHSRKKH